MNYIYWLYLSTNFNVEFDFVLVIRKFCSSIYICREYIKSQVLICASVNIAHDVQISLCKLHKTLEYRNFCHHQGRSRLCFRDSPVASSSLVTRRFGGWRTGGSHEYVRCPVRQPASMDERCYRRSYESDATRPLRHHHYHRRADIERHMKSCEYARRAATESSIEVQHFGLPILSVSEPSPPDESERVDDYL
ncbi:hypothetical protein G5I_14581 [Acromyrmex echinatior]|uniref:Uncharacterized protein n=1 Tax=Acromyrmex echinatior TaxID=103372 RepID=F4X844_ACREC|nr:hypothetical protein G5I_14581 [Acromyrmex echinatior]